MLGTSKTIKIKASKENTIHQLIKHIFYVCRNPQDFEHVVPLPYDTPEGNFNAILNMKAMNYDSLMMMVKLYLKWIH